MSHLSTSTMGGAFAVPPYSCPHHGPVIVCGNAWCLFEDFQVATKLYPNAPVIAVNGAARNVRASFLFTQHPRKFPTWISHQKARFWDKFTTHAAGKAHTKTNLGVKIEDWPFVDYWWDGIATGGTSAWGARRLAAALGFEEVILCGVPLVPGGYAEGGFSKSNKSEETMWHYRSQIARDTDMHVGVSSMSGWTREFFGEPPRRA